MPFVSLEEVDADEKIAGYLGRFVHGDDMTVATWSVEAGASFPEHAHPHEQVAVVLEGTFELTVGGETEVLMPGRIAVIPGGVPHSGTAKTDCRLLDVFHPVREDYQ